MNDKLIRVGAIGMIGVAMAIGYVLMQSSEASNGPKVKVPVTANVLQPELDKAVKEVDFSAMPSSLSERNAPAPLGQPAAPTSLAARAERARATLSQDFAEMQIEVPQFEVPQFEMGAQMAAVAPEQMAPPSPDAMMTDANLGGGLAMIDECAPLMRLDVEDGAMLRVLVSAPCHTGQTVQISHGPLRYAVTIDAEGGHLSKLPAMEQTGAVSVTFPDGIEIADAAEVAEVSDYHRVALVGEAAMGLELHAFEAGAAFGAPGHVHKGNPAGQEGQMIVLGDASAPAPVHAQVYSIPMTLRDLDLALDLTVEAEVRADNCGAELSGVTMVSEGGDLVEKAIQLALPACDAVGDFVVLNGLFRNFQG